MCTFTVLCDQQWYRIMQRGVQHFWKSLSNVQILHYLVGFWLCCYTFSASTVSVCTGVEASYNPKDICCSKLHMCPGRATTLVQEIIMFWVKIVRIHDVNYMSKLHIEVQLAGRQLLNRCLFSLNHCCHHVLPTFVQPAISTRTFAEKILHNSKPVS